VENVPDGLQEFVTDPEGLVVREGVMDLVADSVRDREDDHVHVALKLEDVEVEFVSDGVGDVVMDGEAETVCDGDGEDDRVPLRDAVPEGDSDDEVVGVRDNDGETVVDIL
jgi:hypothetical protein